MSNPLTSWRAFLCAGLVFAGASASAQTEATLAPLLPENVDIHGVLDCEIRGDIRLVVSENRFLRCDFKPYEGIDVLNRYSGYVKAVEDGFSAQEGDFACWNVLYLSDPEQMADRPASIGGAYSGPAASVVEEYELKDDTLVGGSMKVFALKPRCVQAERAGRNIADVIERIELVR